MRHLLALMPTATVMAFAQLITVQYWRNQGIGRYRDRVWFKRKEKKCEQLNRDLFDRCVNDEDHVGWKGGTVQPLGNNAVIATAASLIMAFFVLLCQMGISRVGRRCTNCTDGRPEWAKRGNKAY